MHSIAEIGLFEFDIKILTSSVVSVLENSFYLRRIFSELLGLLLQ